MQATIESLTKREEANKRMVQEMREKQKQLLATIDRQTKIEEANNRTLQEMREEQKQLQTTTNDQTKTVEALKQKFEVLCGQPENVSTCKVEAVTTS
jgi:predicted nuclease with TOPRIM domain